MKGRYIKKEEFVCLFMKEWVQAAVYVLVGFLCSNATLFKTLSPFGIALCCVGSGINMYACVVGAIIGYSTFGSAGVVIKYIGAVVLCVIFKWLFSYKTSDFFKKFSAPITAFFSLMLSGGILAVLTNANGYVYFSLFIESLIASAMAVFFENAMLSLSYRRALCRLGSFSLCSVAVSVCVIIVSLQNFSVSSFSLGSIVAGYLTLTIALNSGALAASATGAILGVGLGLFDVKYMSLCAVLSLGGLLAGTFKNLGKSRMIVIFLVSAIFLSLLSEDDSQLIPNTVEMFFSCILFLLFTIKNEYLENIASPQSHSSNIEDLRHLFDRRVLLTCESLSEIGDITKRVSVGLDRNIKNAETTVLERTASEVCEKCTMHDYCWESHRDRVKNAFHAFVPVLRQNGSVREEESPEYFSTRCCKGREIIKNINQNYNEALSLVEDEDKLSSVRQVICEQFDAMAGMLDQLREELKSVKTVKSELSDKISAAFREMGLTVDYVCVSERDFERISVEMCVSEVERESVPDRHLIKVINEITDREYDYPTVRTIGDKMYYFFNEKACLDFDYFVEQTSLNPSDVSGDSIGCFNDTEQFFNVVISDGMGAGRRAAVDSRMTVSLITKLIKSGFLYHNAINVVNSAMLVKSNEETLSSVDAMHLDLYTGKAEFSKCGAAPTFVYRKNERVHVLENTALPIGILGGVKTQKNEMYLKSGDIVVMVTDGICDEEYIWLENLIMRHCDRSPKEICKFIMKEVQDNNPLPDDRTVMVGRVVANV